jgi:translation elongation factor P/translation initiation factor 5A
MWLKILSRQILGDIRPIQVYGDNQSCIKMCKGGATQRTKHIDIQSSYVRDCITKGDINLEYVDTKRNKADILTKPSTKTVIGALTQGISCMILAGRSYLTTA